MKVLFLSNSMGGLKSFRLELIESLLMNGNEVGICAPCEIIPDFFENMGCEIFPIKMSRHGKNPFAELKLLNEYKKIIRIFGPNIVSAYTIKPNIYGCLACRKLNIPIIASVTGLGSAVENGGLMRSISVSLMRISMKYANHVYFQNKESLDFFEKHSIYIKSKSLIAGSGVNIERFSLVEYPSEDKVKFLYIGRILEAKGIGLYLEAAKVIKEKYPNTEFHIVGIKDDVKFSELVDRYHNDGIIIFHGYQKDPRKFIKNSHCQIHPTYYPEGMSNVLLESAAMGRPAITTDRSGCKEIVEDGVNGYVIPQRDLTSLIKAIEKFIRLPLDEKRQMGLNAHGKVSREFDRKHVVDDYISRMKILAK